MDTPAQPQEDERQSQLKLLIAKGKEQGYLTYSEVNDHLPSDIVDPEQIEDIIGMINDMGIAVYEKAPDAESLLLSDNAGRRPTTTPPKKPPRRSSAVDAEFGRTTDPGAHVHARDGYGRAAHARRRDRDRQAHRGRPRSGSQARSCSSRGRAS